MSKREELDFKRPQSNSSTHLPLMRVLVKLNLVNQQLCDRYADDADRLPISYFSRAGCYEEEQAIRLVSLELGIPIISFDSAIKKEAFALLNNEPFSSIKFKVWTEGRAVPIKATPEEVTVCLANPLDMELTRQLEFHLQRRVRVAITSEKEISEILSLKSDGKGEIDFNELFQSGEPLKLKNTDGGSRDLESNITSEDISTPTVIKLVNRIFASSIQQGASDIHITPESAKLVVRIRVDGILRDFLEVPQNLVSPLIARIKILCGMDITERRQPQDARLRLKTNSGQRDLRISTVPTAYAEDIVIRVLSSDLGNISLDTLGMPEEIRGRFCDMLKTSSKVHLVTGPTGSGKTSTLYAGLLFLHDGKTRIITIEDPIEYRIPGVSQIQVNSKIDMTFAKALRSVLRQDPDIVLVGEIRDSETAITATQVAQTGHLVLSTLHTNNAIAAITRLRDLGIKSFLISSSLGSVTAQRLVRRLCTSCLVDATPEEVSRAEKMKLKTDKLKTSKGCEKCSDTGFTGRMGIFSFLEITHEIAQAIHDDVSEDGIETLARRHGYISLEEAGLQLVEEGMTTFDELERSVGPLSRLDQSRVPRLHFDTAKNNVPEKAKGGAIQKRKLLLVDDDVDLRSLYAHILELQMFDVKQAVDGLMALDAVYNDPPDVIVLDIMMPKMNGFEVVERLRSDTKTRNIPILMLTASTSDDAELDLIKKGADDFVSKTSRAEIIVARVNRLVNRI